MQSTFNACLRSASLVRKPTHAKTSVPVSNINASSDFNKLCIQLITVTSTYYVRFLISVVSFFLARLFCVFFFFFFYLLFCFVSILSGDFSFRDFSELKAPTGSTELK